MSKIIKQIAKKHGVSTKQVEKDMKEAIRIAMLNKNNTAESKAIWDKLSPDGKEPSIDEFIKFCINYQHQAL